MMIPIHVRVEPPAQPELPGEWERKFPLAAALASVHGMPQVVGWSHWCGSFANLGIAILTSKDASKLEEAAAEFQRIIKEAPEAELQAFISHGNHVSSRGDLAPLALGLAFQAAYCELARRLKVGPGWKVRASIVPGERTPNKAQVLPRGKRQGD